MEQGVRGRVARVRFIHDRGRDADYASRPRLAHDGAREIVRRMLDLVPLRRAIEIDEETSVLDFVLVTRNAVRFVARLALARAAMKLPVVPRTDDVIAF